jgi:hypothetical protein
MLFSSLVLSGKPPVPKDLDFEIVSNTKHVTRYYTPLVKQLVKKLELAEDQR